jgi:hypothetical protein
LAGFNLVGQAALDLNPSDDWRVIANDFSCPQGSGQSACMHTDTATFYYFYGNNVHNVGDAAGLIDKYYHAVYFTTNTNHVQAGWNTIVPNPNHSTTSGGCRAIQFFSTGGSDQFDLHVHDNLIHDAICDGINFATVNPNNGTVEAYNNVIYHVGTGPDPGNGASNYACILGASSGVPTTAVQIYNNTMYDCGSRGVSEGDAGAIAINLKMALTNNIIYQLASEGYFTNSTSGNVAANLTGSNNVWFGLGNGPTQTTNNVNSDPKFVSTSTPDFHLQSSGSPAKGAGQQYTEINPLL